MSDTTVHTEPDQTTTNTARPRGQLRRTARFVLAKLVGAAVSLVLVSVLAFLLFRVLPGDPVRAMTHGAPVSGQQLVQLRHRLGLDQPIPVQLVHYLRDLAHGDLGTSYLYNRPVSTLLLERLGPTLLLVGTATVLAVLLGLWIGTRAAWRRGTRFDKLSMSTALALWSVPQFWLGLILLMAFAVGMGPLPGMFPTGGISNPSTAPGWLPHVIDVAHHLVLPAVTLVAVLYAQYLMVMRSSLLEEMHADYLTTARAKGLRDDLVRRRHAVPNALLPTVTLIFLHLGMVVAGAITVETVYSWPGLGLLTYQALQVPDLPLLQGTFLLMAGSVILLNMVAELLYRFFDPRVRVT